MKALILVLTFGHVLYDDSVSAGMILDWQQYRELVDVKQDNVFSKSRNLQENDNEVDHDEPLNEIDFENAKNISIKEPPEDALEKAGLFEGDINISKTSFRPGWRNALSDTTKLWPNGEVPYTIKGFNSEERSVIARAIDRYHTVSCIRFVPRTSQDNYINIMKGNGCYAIVGMQGGDQEVSLGKGCVYYGIILHELMHTVGFFHEQSRGDRDKYVKILWENIDPLKMNNFHKYSWKHIQKLGEKYDLGSIMHYNHHAFSVNRGQPTIIPKDPKDGTRMGQRKEFSEVDIRKINKLYKCSVSSSEADVRSTSRVKRLTINKLSE